MAVTDPRLKQQARPTDPKLVEGYRRLSAVWHEVLSAYDLEAVLEKIADALAELIPYDTLTIYKADIPARALIPILARDPWAAEEILQSRGEFGVGLTGWAVEHGEPLMVNRAEQDPRAVLIEGTELTPESIVVVPLIARASLKGALAIYRIGEDALFDEEEFELARLFADAAALALDNAEIRSFLEHEAQTDSLTGLYNHRAFHERLRSELTRVSRSGDSMALLMFDLDDFKKLNDVYGHLVGDQVLLGIADLLRSTVRGSDIVFRLGGEEFTVIMPSCDAGDALGLATRISTRLSEMVFEPAGSVTISLGIAQGPEHAMNPRELHACAEAAMMTAKARGKNRIVLFDETATERPDVNTTKRDVRSIAHLKMLQSLSGKLNRLNDVREIGVTIATELRALIDYHNCRVYSVDGTYCVPIAFHGEWTREDESAHIDVIPLLVGEGITGTVAQTGKPMLVPDARQIDFAVHLPGTAEIEESILAAPLLFGNRSVGVIVISKLGVEQFDQDDVRLMEVIAGHAAVALENARLYEREAREAESGRALLRAADILAKLPTVEEVMAITPPLACEILGVTQVSLWIADEKTGDFSCTAHIGYEEDESAAAIVDIVVPRDVAELFLGDRTAPFITTPDEAEPLVPTPEGALSRTVATAPLPGTHVLGGIQAREPAGSPFFFNDERLQLFAAFAYLVSTALDRALLDREQKENAEIANSLLEFGHGLANTEIFSDVLQKIVDLSSRTLGGVKTSAWLQEPETGDIVVEAMRGYDPQDIPPIAALRFPAHIAAEFLGKDEPYLLTHESVEGLGQLAGFELTGPWAIAPLKLDNGRLGCLVASGSKESGNYEFTEMRMRLLTGMAQQARLAINNAVNFEGLESTFIATVEALANALEAKDQYTSKHARSITDLALETGRMMGIEGKDLKRLELAALFHDIGKIGIPSDILLKAGPLTEQQRIVMEGHPELGERILAPVSRLRDVSHIIRSCHERFDGGGYPDGRRGEQIPLEARIIFVCDAYDAMTTNRPYRASLGHEEAIRRLEEASGSQFDPEIVTTFLSVISHAGAVPG